jgi:RimJ/RimL family protein N-acetyltransferase
MRPEEIDGVVAVQEEGAVAAFGHIFPQDAHPFPRAEVRQRWAYELSRSDVQCFVVEGPNRVVDGFVAISGNQLLHFGTAKSTWGSGLAGQAHDEVLDHLREQGHSRAWLSVLEQNGRARHFYERRGWVPTGRSIQSGFPPHPVLLGYERDLTEP